MTEITKLTERKIRYSVNPTAFFFALICAPLLVTALSFWTLIGLFALPFGIVPYLVIGTPILLWAAGHVRPNFRDYAKLGLAGNFIMGLGGLVIADPDTIALLFVFGLIFAPLYTGAFGSLYASFHPNMRILQT